MCNFQAEKCAVFKRKKQPIKNSIFFNHRDNRYTGWNWLLEVLDELWQRRQDFRLYTTNANADKPYIEKVPHLSRPEYLKFIRTMYLGVACFDKYSAWSSAVTDGLTQGVPYLLPNKLCYPEMLGDYPLFYEGQEDFKLRLNRLLDSTAEIDSAVQWLKPRVSDFLWEERVPLWFNGWKVLDELPTMKRTQTYERIVSFIKSNRAVFKSDIMKYMGWSGGIRFSAYRNLLRHEPGIILTKNAYKYIV